MPAPENPTAVAVIGCGRMGGGIAAALAGRCVTVYAYDENREALGALPQEVLRSGTIAAAVEAATTVLTVVPGPPELDVVADQILAAAARGTNWLQMSTVSPNQVRRLWHRARVTEVELMDVAIVGTPTLAKQGELTVLVGGEDGSLDPELLAAIGTPVWCGSLGAGMTPKVIANLLSGAITTATGEALAIGRRSGIPDDVLVSTLMKTGARNGQLEGPYPERSMRGDIKTHFSTEVALKDVELGLELASELRLVAATGEGARAALMRSVAAGYQAADVTALLSALLAD